LNKVEPSIVELYRGITCIVVLISSIYLIVFTCLFTKFVRLKPCYRPANYSA